MVLDIAKLHAGREDYDVREIADSRADYYSGRGEAWGHGYGAASAALGLDGIAADGTDGGNLPFRRIFHGRDPVTGALLGREHGQGGVHGFDLVFRPVKSVSIVYGLGSRELAGAMVDAHHAGLRAAVAYLEEHVGARRGHNGTEKVKGNGLLAVGFDHRTSRAGDPLLQTHLVVANRIQGPDGRWTALDGKTLYAHAMAAQVIYHTALQREVTQRTGLRWAEPGAHGFRELAGIDQPTIRHFSKRRVEIEAGLATLAADGVGTGALAAEHIAHQTRQAKEHHVPEAALRDRWRPDRDALADVAPDSAAGLRAILDRAERGVRKVGRHELAAPTDAELGRVFDRLAGPDGLTRQASTFARRDVVAALGAELATPTPAELEALADRFIAERAIPTADGEPAVTGGGEPRWSVPGLLEVEQRLIVAAVDRQAADVGLVDPGIARQVIDRASAAGLRLGPDQAAMVAGVLTDGQGVSVVIGRAGSGKTTAADVARQGFQRAGYDVMGVAPTGVAAQQLGRDTSLDTATVDSLLGELTRGEFRLSARSVVLCDEAAMLASRRLAPLLDHAAQAGAKVVLIGDHKQFQPVDAGGGFRALAVRLGAYELTENRRQRHELDREAVELLRAGRGDEAIGLYQAAGRVHLAESLAETQQAMVTAWWQGVEEGRDVIMLDQRRSDLARLNQLARERMAAAGRLGEQALVVDDREFRIGDRVLCGLNALSTRNTARNLGVANGTKATVTALDPDRGELRIRTDDGHETSLPRWYLTRQLPDGRRALDHGYAFTGHKSQSGAWDYAVARAGAHLTQEWGYVVGTRVRERLDLFGTTTAREVDPNGEMDVPPGPARLATEQAYTAAETAARAATRSEVQLVAVDQRQLGPDVRTMSTRALREQANHLEAQVLAGRPQSRQGELALVQERLAAALAARDHGHGEKREPAGAALWQRQAPADHNDTAKRRRDWTGRRDRRAHPRGGRTGQGAAHATAQVSERHQDPVKELTARQRELARAERQRATWEQLHEPELCRHAAVRRELGWRRQAAGHAVELARPRWLVDFLGPRPDSVRGRRRYRQLAAAVEDYRERYEITDEVRALGGTPRGQQAGLVQRRAHQHLREQAERLWAWQRDRVGHALPTRSTSSRLIVADNRSSSPGRRRSEGVATGRQPPAVPDVAFERVR